MSPRRKKARFALLVLTGAALTSFVAGELLPSQGKPQPARGAEWVEIGIATATDGSKAFVDRRPHLNLTLKGADRRPDGSGRPQLRDQ